MVQAQVRVAWVLVRDDEQVAEWEHDSVLVFQTEREAKTFSKRVIGRTPLRGRCTPRPLVGRLLAQVQNRPLAVRLNNDKNTVNYAVIFNATRPSVAFAAAREAVREAA